MAPILPFTSEHIWQNMVRELEPNAAKSVLLAPFPTEVMSKNYSELTELASITQTIITLSQRLRNENQLKVKQPLQKMYVVSHNEKVLAAVNMFETLLKEELNVKQVLNTEVGTQFNHYYLTVNFKAAGAVLKGEVQKLKLTLEALPQSAMNELVEQFKQGSVKVGEFGLLDASLFVLNSKPKQEFVLASEGDVTVVLDTTLTQELLEVGYSREFIRNGQVLRKDTDFNIDARITLAYQTESELLNKVLTENEQKLKDELLAESVQKTLANANITKEVLVGDMAITISLKTA